MEMIGTATTRLEDATLLSLQHSASAAQWCVAYTYPKHEFKVTQQLDQLGVQSFLPAYESIRRWHDRRVTLSLPLFPGYVFVRCAAKERTRVLQLRGIVCLVNFAGQPAVLSDDEIESLRRALTVRKAQPCPFIANGKRVRFCGGALDGLEGIVIRRTGQTRVVVSIDSIQRSISIETSVADLRSVA